MDIRAAEISKVLKDQIANFGIASQSASTIGTANPMIANLLKVAIIQSIL